VLSATPILKTVDRAEHELLLCCVRPQIDSRVSDRIRSLAAQDLDWEYLFLLARRHSVVALLYWGLQETAADIVPTLHYQRLQKHFQENAARNIVLNAELCRLLAMLDENGIEAIPYKGPVLALFAYNNLSLRRFVDLDVMVKKEDAARSIDLLLADGYEVSKSFSLSQRKVLLQTQHNLQLHRSNRQLIVELHWEVASQLFVSSVQADDLWGGLVPIEINGAAIKTLSAEDLLFSLSVHALRHVWEKLLWICDLAWIVSRYDLDWEVLLQRARSTKIERNFLLGLQLCRRLLGVALPEQIAQQIERDSSIDKLADVVIEFLLNGTEHIPASSLEHLKFNLLVRPSWLARARYFRHILNPTDGDLTVSLPGSLSFGYYLMRPFRLLFKAGGHQGKNIDR
jgi:hypothetical protein